MTKPFAVGALEQGNQAASPSTDAAIGDWDDLFRAVKARLRLTVDQSFVPGRGIRRLDPAACLQASVLECADALDQLHSTLVHEADHRHRLELDLAASRAALAQTRAELSATRANEKRARHSALHDGLTLLPNSGHFRAQLDAALSQAARDGVAVLYLDLDGFKPINDTYGHDTGDELLRIIAARLTRSVRAEDKVGRLGGDEFACLLFGMPSREQLSHLARKLLDALSAPVGIGQLQISVRPSIGIAMSPADATSPDALLRNADAAMYHAKRRKCGYAFFDERSEAVGSIAPGIRPAVEERTRHLQSCQ